MSAYPTASTNATTASPTTSGAPGAGQPVMSDEALVYTVDLLFAIFIGVYALIRLPRALALFGASKEWLNGHYIRNVACRVGYTTGGTYPAATMSGKGDGSFPNAWSSDDSHTPYTRPQPQRFNQDGLPVAPQLPLHVAACPRLLRPFLTLLRMRVAPGFAISQVIILTVYLFCVAYAGFYRSDIFADSTRTGWVAISQLPVVFMFAQKNNVLGWILGYGYEKLNFLHRFAGRLVVLATNIHSLHWIYKWSLAGTLAQRLQSPSNYWGLISLICMDLLFFGSTEFWRKKAYNVFLTTHIVGFSLVLPAIYLHKRSMLTLIWVSLGAYAMDHLFRILKTRVATAHLRPLPELDATRVEIPSLNAGWRAGQHVRLRVLSTAMGWGAWMEVHPFTIASVTKSEEGMVLLVKKAGGWTKKMYEVAKKNNHQIDNGVGMDVKVIIEGPYGGPTHTIMSSFSAAVFVAGGSGITFALSSIQDLIQKDLAGESRVRVIELVWIISDPASLAPLLPQLGSMIQQSVHTPLRISVFYTREPTGKQPAFVDASSAGPFSSFSDSAFKTDKASISKLPRALNLQGTPRTTQSTANVPHASIKRSATLTAWERLHGISEKPQPATPTHAAPEAVEEKALPVPAGLGPPGLTLAAGRPRIINFLEGALERTLALRKGQHYTRASDTPRLTGMLVGVCGPLAMADNVIEAVGAIDSARRDEIGGVEIVEEGFGW